MKCIPRFTIRSSTRKLVGQRLSPCEARRRALVTFGGLDAQRETMRDDRGARWFHDLGADVRYAFNGMRRSPGFALAGALTLGIGIGINGAIFGYVNSILLRPLTRDRAHRRLGRRARDGRPALWSVAERSDHVRDRAAGAGGRGSDAVAGASGRATRADERVAQRLMHAGCVLSWPRADCLPRASARRGSWRCRHRAPDLHFCPSSTATRHRSNRTYVESPR